MKSSHIRQYKSDGIPTFKNMDILVEDMERRKMSSAAICFALMAANTALECTAKAAEAGAIYTRISATWHKVHSEQGLFFAATKAAVMRKAATAIPKHTPTLPAPAKPERRTGSGWKAPLIARRVHQRRTAH